MFINFVTITINQLQQNLSKHAIFYDYSKFAINNSKKKEIKKIYSPTTFS